MEDDHLDQYLNSVCIRYGLTAYLSNSSNEPSKRNGGKNNDRTEVGDDQKRSDGIPLIDDLAEMLKKGPSYYDEKIEITDGIRHNTILKIADSILFRYSDDHDLRVLKDWFILINEHCCRPQLGTSERNKMWNDAVEYVGKQKALESQRILTVSEAVREGHGSNKTVRGTIFSVSTLFKVATSLYYKCMSCGTINNGFIGITIYFGHENNNNHSSSSGRCVNCAERMLELDYKLSTFNDAKIVVLQNADLTADLDETLEVMLLGEHTKDVKAGEVVVIRGSIYYGASNLGKQSKTKKTITLMTAKFVTYEGRQNIDITESDIEAFHRFATLVVTVT